MLDILQYEFMQRAIIAGLLISLLAPILGTFVVAGKSSLLSDTFGHTSLAGIGLGLLLSFEPVYGALGFSILSAFFIEMLIRKMKISNDAIHAVFLSGSLALAVLLTHLQSSASIGFENYLFGSLLTVSMTDIYLLVIALIVVCTCIYFFYWQLVLTMFNVQLGQAKGINTKMYKMLLSVLLAVTVALSLKTIGGLLIGALIVLPVITARQFTHSFSSTLFVSVIFSFFFVFSGLIVSTLIDVPSGAAIVLIGIASFACSLLFAYGRIRLAART